MKNPFYLPLWFLRARLLGRKAPLQTVLFINDQCNLRCKHCSVYAKATPIIKSYQTIETELRYAYQKGARFVDFEGGEPFLWSDEQHRNINDLCDLAKRIGFFSTTITTNAQKAFDASHADSIWVSLDGLGEYHEYIRGPQSFERLEKHIAQAKHQDLSVNMVIQKHNHSNVEAVLEYVKKSPYIKSVSFNFYTPTCLQPMMDDPRFANHQTEATEADRDLFIDDWRIRESVIDTIIRYKKKGYPVMNSVSGLKLMKHNQFKKYCWVSNFILPDGTRLDECPGLSQGVCDQCGFCMAGEMHSVMSLKPDTIWAALKLRAGF